MISFLKMISFGLLCAIIGMPLYMLARSGGTIGAAIFGLITGFTIGFCLLQIFVVKKFFMG